MGFRFFRRIKIAPGLSLNLSKSGGSLSFGPRGAKFTIGSSGARTTFGIPGTGLFYTKKLGTSAGRRSFSRKNYIEESLPVVPASRKLEMSFFKRLIVPDDEEALVDGLREMTQENYDKALEYLQQALHLADGAFTAGFLFLKKDHLEQAVECLNKALSMENSLGRYFDKYGIMLQIKLPITKEITAVIAPNKRGVLLTLAEAYQRLGKFQDAEICLRELLKLLPEDILVKLSLTELLLSESPDKDRCKEVVQLAEGINNESEIHSALILYKAKALRRLGVLDPAKDLITQALRRAKSLPDELVYALRYERALVYEDLNQTRKARSEFEKIYAENPTYEDVAKKLGL